MLVKVRPSAREVIATYKLNEEASIELVIQLPANYPLGSITVEGGRKVGVTANQWRNWMLQLTTFLMHQVNEKFSIIVSSFFLPGVVGMKHFVVLPLQRNSIS